MSSNTSAIGQILNPLTPLAFMHPKMANQFANATNIMLWDFLSNLPEDFQLVVGMKVELPTVVYFLSRISSVTHSALAAILLTAPTHNCATMGHALMASQVVAVSFTSLLFFLRLRAIFQENPNVVRFFFVQWLAVVSCCILVFHSIVGRTIGPTNYCLVVIDSQSLAALSVGATLVNDTLIFLAITYKLGTVNSGWAAEDLKLRTRISGKSLPAFSRALLQGSQVYYLVAVTAQIATLTLYFVWESPESPYRMMALVPTIVLVNIMACRVYRNTKLRLLNTVSAELLTRFDTPPLFLVNPEVASDRV
ncbi:hypothetical protein B0H34DRAFT_440096 [Crassisporium funariophilum]|nr:hypothetical protein B0H34DRAFT_440096 [Crassisporium funariophilum]